MANRNNTGRSKKSHNYRPYDTSNSFVKRFTAKVSEILPQPTSWVSRFFSASPKLNVREREELEEEEEDEEERQPPSKRLCFSTTETNDYTHQNNINRLDNIDGDGGDISPIVSSRVEVREDERAVPGPSGLHLRHFPISSTPAVRTTPIVSLRDKGQQGQERSSHQQHQPRDDASDESESTSGCSSLVPGTHPRQEPSTPTTPTNLQSALTSSTLGSMRRISSTNKKSNISMNRTSLNLSTSSQPAFDTYVFNNPLNRSGIRKRLLGDESCFYPGNTTFGGSSSRSPVVESPRIVTVRPSPTRQVQEDTIGSSALKILRALEQFSTPVMDAKRMPIRRPGTSVESGKRKPPQPYEELIFPSMPDLLRVKRRERELRAAERLEKAEVSSPAQSTSESNPSSSQQPSTLQSQHTLRVENPEEEFVGKIKGWNRDKIFPSARIPVINLPNDIKLQISSLPKLDLKLSGEKDNKTPTLQSKSLPSTCSPPFKFSEPQIPKISDLKVVPLNLPVNKFKFSEPLEPLVDNSKIESPESSFSGFTSDKPLPPEHQMKNPTPNLTLKRKTSQFSTATKNELLFGQPLAEEKKLSPTTTSNTGLVSGINETSTDKKSTTSEKSTNSEKALSKENVSSSNLSWDCLKCSLKNSLSGDKCKSCGLKKDEKPSKEKFKSFQGFSKPKDTWECKECLVNNKNTDDKCVACSVSKIGKPAVKSGFELPSKKSSDVKTNDIGAKSRICNSLKSKDGSWECDTCLVKNKKDDLKCVACSTSKPGAKSVDENKSAFTFGIPSNNSSPRTFSLGNTGTKPPQSQFSFGIPSESTVSKSGSAPIFGAEKKSTDSVTTSSSISNPIFSSVSSSVPLVNSIKKVEGSWECQVCLVQNKKESTSCAACNTPKPGSEVAEKPKTTFTFGIPATSSNNTVINVMASTGPASCSSSSVPVFTFGNSSVTKEIPKTTSSFSFSTSSSTNVASSNALNEIKPFNFMNSDQIGDKDAKAPVQTGLFTFGNSNLKDTKTDEMNDEQSDKPAKKRVSFGNPLTSEKILTNDKTPAVTFGTVTQNKTNEIAPSSNFTFTPFENSTNVPTTSNSFFTFGGSTEEAKIKSIVPAATKPLSFGGSSDTGIINSNSTFGSSLGGFKMPEPENKPFTFLTNSQTPTPSSGFAFNSTNQMNEFNSQPNQPKSNSLVFGQQQQPAPLFGQTQEQTPFVFNAPAPTTQQSVFSLNTTPSQAAATGLGTNAPSGGFNFSAPTAPKFNFTGGAATSFNATGTPNPTESSERKIKRGIRRLTANR